MGDLDLVEGCRERAWDSLRAVETAFAPALRQAGLGVGWSTIEAVADVQAELLIGRVQPPRADPATLLYDHVDYVATARAGLGSDCSRTLILASTAWRQLGYMGAAATNLHRAALLADDHLGQWHTIERHAGLLLLESTDRAPPTPPNVPELLDDVDCAMRAHSRSVALYRARLALDGSFDPCDAITELTRVIDGSGLESTMLGAHYLERARAHQVAGDRLSALRDLDAADHSLSLCRNSQVAEYHSIRAAWAAFAGWPGAEESLDAIRRSPIPSPSRRALLRRSAWLLARCELLHRLVLTAPYGHDGF